MIHRLRRIPRVTAPATIRRVRTEAMADRLAKAARSRQILPEHLAEDTPQRQYVAMAGDAIVGWVGSIAVGDATWCQNMYVAPAYRRRGIARAMLCRLLRDDRAAGTVLAVLLASHTGAKLYASVGYVADRHAAVLHAQQEVGDGLNRADGGGQSGRDADDGQVLQPLVMRVADTVLGPGRQVDGIAFAHRLAREAGTELARPAGDVVDAFAAADRSTPRSRGADAGGAWRSPGPCPEERR